MIDVSKIKNNDAILKLMPGGTILFFLKELLERIHYRVKFLAWNHLHFQSNYLACFFHEQGKKSSGNTQNTGAQLILIFNKGMCLNHSYDGLSMLWTLLILVYEK